MVVILLSKKLIAPAESKWFAEVEGNEDQNASAATHDAAVLNLVRELPGDNPEYTVRGKTHRVKSAQTPNAIHIEPLNRKGGACFGSR